MKRKYILYIRERRNITTWEFPDIESAMHKIALYQADSDIYSYICDELCLSRKKFWKEVPLLYYDSKEEFKVAWKSAREWHQKILEEKVGRV